MIELTPTLDGLRVRQIPIPSKRLAWWAGAVALAGASVLGAALSLGWALKIDYTLGKEIIDLRRAAIVRQAESVAREGCWRDAYGKKAVGEWVDRWVMECAKRRLVEAGAFRER